MSVLIVALAGRKGSGKTALAKQFLNHYPDALHLSFATPLKEMAKVAGFSEEELYGPHKERTHLTLGISMREFCMLVGDSLRNVFPVGYSFTTRILQTALLETSAEVIIVDDLRYPDELKLLQSFHAAVFRVVREDDHEHIPTMGSPALMRGALSSSKYGTEVSHSSETALDDYNLEIIYNNHSQQELFIALQNRLMNRYKPLQGLGSRWLYHGSDTLIRSPTNSDSLRSTKVLPKSK